MSLTMAAMSMPAARPVATAAATTTMSGFNLSPKPRMTMPTPTKVSMCMDHPRDEASDLQRRLEAALEVRIAQRDAGLPQELVVLDALGFLHEAHDAGAEHALRLLHADERRLGHAGEFRQQEQVVGDGRRAAVADVVERAARGPRHHLVADRDQVVDVDAVGEAAFLRLDRRHAG